MDLVPADRANRTTRAADGFARRTWTCAEVLAMVRFGIVDENERFELIGGEAVPMASKGIWHELAKNKLMRFLARAVPDEVEMAIETTLYLTPIDFREPDFMYWPAHIIRRQPEAEVPVPQLLLIIEVADTSLSYDLGEKARTYARFGLREYWVIDATRLATHVHREPTENGYAVKTEYAYTDTVTPAFLPPGVTVCLADLGLSPVKD